MSYDKLKIFSYIIILLLLVFLSFIFLFFMPKDKVCFDDACIYVDIAKTQEDKQKWLMNVDYLESDSWMLFVFDEEDKHWFWMKNTLIPLDILWINDNEVVSIKDNAQPCKDEYCDIYYPSEAADYVLEVNAWKAKEMWILTWSLVELIY